LSASFVKRDADRIRSRGAPNFEVMLQKGKKRKKKKRKKMKKKRKKKKKFLEKLFTKEQLILTRIQLCGFQFFMTNMLTLQLDIKASEASTCPLL